MDGFFSPPQIIRPVMYDQPDNTFRIHRLGLGVVVLPSCYSAPRVMRHVNALISSDAVNGRLRKASSGSHNCVSDAADVIGSIGNRAAENALVRGRA